MPSKPLHDFLNAHLKNCCTQKTSAQESGIQVRTEPLLGEKILFFHTDCDEGRTCLKMKLTGASSNKICDYLIYYTKDDQERETVCFLELRSTDLASATEPIKDVHKQTNMLIRDEIPGKCHEDFAFRVCICLRSQAPSTGQHIKNLLIQTFGKGNVEIKHGTTPYDIGPFLRHPVNKDHLKLLTRGL